MRHFQRMGHTVVFSTAILTGHDRRSVGKSENAGNASPARRCFANAETYKRQVFKILDPAVLPSRFQLTHGASRWASPTCWSHLTLHMSPECTSADDFANRYREGKRFPYWNHVSAGAGYESVALRPTSSSANGPEVQPAGRSRSPAGIRPGAPGNHDAPLPGGLDGSQKMSKSLGNYIGINESPREISAR